MAQRRFAYPARGSFLSATERNQRAPQGLCPWESHQGVPPGSPKGWGNKRPIPSYPCGAIGRSPVGGIPPPATPTGPPPSGRGLEQSLVSISPWPAGLVAKRLVPHRSGEHRIRPTERRASARRHTLPGAPRLTVVLEPGLCLESEAEKSGNARTELGGSRKPSCQHNHRRRSPSLGDGPETVQHKR